MNIFVGLNKVEIIGITVKLTNKDLFYHFKYYLYKMFPLSCKQFWRFSKCNFVKFQVLTAASMNMTVFWDVAPCNLIKDYRRFRDAYCLHYRLDDAGRKYLWNVGKLLPFFTAQHPRRQSFKCNFDWMHFCEEWGTSSGCIAFIILFESK
jgi:hypothetical protein